MIVPAFCAFIAQQILYFLSSLDKLDKEIGKQLLENKGKKNTRSWNTVAAEQSLLYNVIFFV